MLWAFIQDVWYRPAARPFNVWNPAWVEVFRKHVIRARCRRLPARPRPPVGS